MSGDHVDEAMREMIDGRDKKIAALCARVAELEEKMATALQHLEKGRALWNGPSHQCASVLRGALGMGEQSAQNTASLWREQAQFWEHQTAALRAQNAKLVAALEECASDLEAEARLVRAALTAAGHEQGSGK